MSGLLHCFNAGCIKPAPLVDPYFANVSLLLHMDGANNGTSFPDSSNHNRTVSVFGNAKTTTSTPKFGTASVTFDGSGDYLSVADSASLEFGSGAYTVEFFFRPAVNYNSGTSQRVFVAKWGTANFSFIIDYSLGSVRHVQSVNASNTSNLANLGFAVNLTAGTWYHLAFTSTGNGGTMYSFLDGVNSASMTAKSCANATSPLLIGFKSDGTSEYLNGDIDDLRITVGIARYTASFTPPSAPFADS